MNEFKESDLNPAETRAREAVRALPGATPDPAFRARLAESFKSGAFPAPGRRIVPLPWYRRGVISWIAVPAAAAAALAVVMVLNQGPRWELAASEGAGVVVVDDRPIPMNHTEDLRRALHPGAKVSIPEGGEVRIAAGKDLLILATAGTDFVMPAAPGRWFGRSVATRMERGTLRVTTGGGFPGGRLVVATPDADVEVTGSTLAIICEPAGTCVCVLDGHVMVGSSPNDRVEVAGGMRRFIFGDGREPVLDEMRPMERTKLTMFRDQALGAS
jgi:ferric-dicitrate binding protein FerR (iron transport regulator)